jgi:16S rRNA (guanine527-N7)-methyltransferase
MQIIQENFPEVDIKKMQAFLELFKERNKIINLSAIRDEQGIVEKHFFDSLLGLEFIKNKKRVIDLGSGGGFPVIALAICFPDAEFFAVESVGKKADSLRYFCKELGMNNLIVLCDRAETIAHDKKYRETFDALTARAFAHFPVLLEIGLPLLSINGEIVAYRGPNNAEEEERLAEFLGGTSPRIVNKSLPNGDSREFWLISKVKKCSAEYPRSIGVPKKNPLNLASLVKK